MYYGLSLILLKIIKSFFFFPSFRTSFQHLNPDSRDSSITTLVLLAGE